MHCLSVSDWVRSNNIICSSVQLWCFFIPHLKTSNHFDIILQRLFWSSTIRKYCN